MVIRYIRIAYTTLELHDAFHKINKIVFVQL